MRLLDFIIPEYNTKQDLLIRALSSINNQKNVNFKDIGIIIVSDGSKKMYKSSWFKQKFPKLNIIYYPKKENDGPGLTRQYGIDRSEAKYITFLDSDDELVKDQLHIIIDTLIYEGLDVIFTNFIEEMYYEGKYYYQEYTPQKLPTLHGLFVNRKFMNDNNIRFSSEIRYQEDTYFAQILIYGYECKIVPKPIYLWKFNGESLVRSDKQKNWNVKIIEDYIKAGELVYARLEMMDKEIRHFQLVTTIYGAFIILQSDDFNDDEDRRKRNLDKLINIYKRIKEKSYDKFSKEKRQEIFDNQYKTTSRSIKVDCKMTFDEYLERNNIE